MKRVLHIRGMFGLREKLSLASASLLLLVMLLGVQQWMILNQIQSDVLDVLSEDLELLGAIDRMQDGIERIDNAISFLLLGEDELAQAQIDEGQSTYHDARERAIELGQSADIEKRLTALDKHYENFIELLSSLDQVRDITPAMERTYVSRMNEEFLEAKKSVEGLEDVIRIRYFGHQARAEDITNHSRVQTAVILIIGLILAAASIYFTSRWVLFPILRLTEAADRVRGGDYNVRVEEVVDDEIGELTQTFNAMTHEIYTYQNTQKSKLLKLYSATQTILTNISDAIALVEPEGIVERSSSIASDVFGLMPGKNISDKEYDWIARLHAEARDHGEAASLPAPDEVVQVFVNGDERFFYPSAIPVRSNDDPSKISNILIVAYDVTQMRIQEELKHDAIATVSHQLKTPLTSIRMALHLLADEKLGSLNEQQHELAESARSEGDRLFQMVEGLLDMSRMKSGQVMLECAPTNVAMMVEDAVQAHERFADDQNITIDYTAEDVEEVWADASRLTHVFMNLINNAIKYTPDGGLVRVAIEYGESTTNIAIEDSGPGVPEEDRNRIFDQFYRGVQADQSSGAGLGLAIANQIVLAHGGSVSVGESSLGGARFFVELPTVAKAHELGLATTESAT